VQVLLERSDNIVVLRAATLSGQVLVARALAGDTAARRTVVERFAGHVAGVLRNVIGGQVPLQDLSQEVFLVVFRDLHRLRDPSALPPWITRIAVHCAQTFLRARRRRRWLVLADDDEAPTEPLAPAGAWSLERGPRGCSRGVSGAGQVARA
jgi:DNA-directed RNA polymerase specialized sigma24 family protein